MLPVPFPLTGVAVEAYFFSALTTESDLST